MRAINSNCTSGTEGIVIAVIEWWIKTHDVERRIVEYAQTADPKLFPYKADNEVGMRLCELLPWIREEFLTAIRGNPAVSYMIALAWGQKPPAPDLEDASLWKAGRLGMLHAELGIIFKATDFFDKIKKTTPRSTVVKMATARLQALVRELPHRNAVVAAYIAAGNKTHHDQKVEEVPKDPTVESLKALMAGMDIYRFAPEKRSDEWKKAHKELVSFLKRPDVDDGVVAEAMDIVTVGEIMAR